MQTFLPYPGFTAAHGWTDPTDLPYVWPIPGGKDPAFWGEGEEEG